MGKGDAEVNAGVDVGVDVRGDRKSPVEHFYPN
jgi:hypothetical protein